MNPITKWILGILGGAMIGIITAVVVWFVPYEVKHHIETNATVIEVAQLSSEWNEFIMRRDLDALLTARSRRPLTDYEEKRLRHLQQEFERLLRTKYK